MKFEWDEHKNIQNKLKHGVSFQEAQAVFNDPLHLAKLDHRFSYFEERWVTIGAINSGKILVVANLFFSDEGEEIIRIISARPANIREKKEYENA